MGMNKAGYLPLDWAAEERKAKELEANIVLSACDSMDVFCDKLEGLGIVIRDTQADAIINEMIQAAMRTIQGEDDEAG
jgi:hypothetical protein